MSRNGPKGPRPHLVVGLALGVALPIIAWRTFPNIHNLWEVPVGIWLIWLNLGKMAAR